MINFVSEGWVGRDRMRGCSSLLTLLLFWLRML
jgi:hypothetical protein